jgi:hypothetical protein
MILKVIKTISQIFLLAILVILILCLTGFVAVWAGLLYLALSILLSLNKTFTELI